MNSVTCVLEKNENTVIWLTDTHPVSGRAFVLEDDGRSCWLYFCENPSGAVVKSVLAYSPIQPVTRADFEDQVQRGDTPVLMADYASGNAIISERYPDDFSFKWRADGNALAITFRDETIAVVSSEERFGSSRAIGRSGPFGDPLVLDHYSWL